jgi:hypothetical protein
MHTEPEKLPLPNPPPQAGEGAGPSGPPALGIVS